VAYYHSERNHQGKANSLFFPSPEYLVQLGLLDRVPDASTDIGLLLERALENSPAPAG
jgi:hypothetical protein